MGLKCSLLGCEYGPVTTERERTQRGGEVVETVREVQHCERCGDPQVVTENKEITTVEAPAQAEETATTDGSDSTATQNAGARPSHSESTGTGSLSGVGDEWQSAPSDPEASQHIEDAEDDGESDEIPQEDDAVIISDSGEESGASPAGGSQASGGRDAASEETETRGSGAIQDTGTTTAEEASGRTEEIQEPAGRGDHESGATGTGGSRTAGTNTSASGSESTDDPGPTVAQGEESEVEVFGSGVDTVEAANSNDDATATQNQGDSGSGPEQSDGTEVVAGGPASAADTEYYCPDCGHTEDALDASLRSGDLCPECLGAYVEERTA